MRYFFDIRDDQLVPDEEGMILPDIGAAQEEATRTLTDLVREAMRGESALPNGNRGPQPAWPCS